MAKKVVKKVVKKVASKGFGDTVEKVFKALAIDKVAKFVLGEDCGCDERKKKLNELFPYRQLKCLTEKEFNYLSANNNEVLTKKSGILPSEQYAMIDIWHRISGVRWQTTSCEPCVRDWQRELLKVLEAYQKENEDEKL